MRQARFKPHRTDDLRAGLADKIGELVEVAPGWTMVDEDDPYPGEVAYLPGEETWRRFGVAWFAERDLEWVESEAEVTL